MTTAIFLRLLETQAKEEALATSARSATDSGQPSRFEVDASGFRDIAGSPFAYWLSSSLRQIFTDNERFESSERTAKLGPSTANDFRYIRAWWELPRTNGARGSVWRSLAKGGIYAPFFGDVHLCVSWNPSRSTFFGFIGRPGRETERPNAAGFFFRPGLTWPLRTKSALSFRALPSGCVFGHKGPAAFVRADDRCELLSLLGLTSSRPFKAFVEVQLAAADARPGGAAHSYEVGIIQSTPVPSLNESDRATLSGLAGRAWSLARSFYVDSEVSYTYVLPSLAARHGNTVAGIALACANSYRRVANDLAEVEAAIDALCFDLYGIDEADRLAMTEGFGGSSDSGDDQAAEDIDVEADEVEDVRAADPATLTADLLSWCVGIAFGRFDIRLATGEREAPPEPDPFDPLPVCSPGMLTGEDGLPLASPPESYPIAWPEDGILVDDPGHPRDLTTAVREVFDVVFGSDADAFWTEASELVDPKGRDIRRWLQKTYFLEHIKRYSKSRRKAPIYWQLATPSTSYSVWLYAHRIGRDSLYQVLNDFVSPKLQAEERKLHALLQEVGPNPSASQRKELDAQESFVSELRVLRDEVARVAPLWNPDLNDGVVIVTAPLYRLVPQLKSWQKELKTHWDALCQGKYDWAQLAMHLWPERVVPKCAEDRSLAIAHDLEDVFWEQDADGKWSARKEPTRAIAELVAKRTSPAVKDALESLLNAPAPAGTRRASRSARAEACS